MTSPPAPGLIPIKRKFSDDTRPKEEFCLGITHEKKYYEFEGSGGSAFVKRSLAESEWILNIHGNLIIPHMTKERLMNEVAAIKYIHAKTDIPVPNLRCAFEDRSCYYIITDHVPGVIMADLRDDQKEVVMQQLEGYVEVMRGLKSDVMGGLLGEACLPYRVDLALAPSHGTKVEFMDKTPYELVFCHNDLSQHNVIVDEQTLKINAIIDWEYAGFYPKEFEGLFYKRPGPSAALNGEENDVPRLLEILDQCRRK